MITMRGPSTPQGFEAVWTAPDEAPWMGRPHRTLFQPTMMGAVARPSFLPNGTRPVKPDCAIRTAANATMRNVPASLGINMQAAFAFSDDL